MLLFYKKTLSEKELSLLYKKEQNFLKKRLCKKESKLNNILDEKVPEKLQTTLNTAFNKAFSIVFEKGITFIEKTYKKEDIKEGYKNNLNEHKTHNTKRTIRAFSQKAKNKENINLALSGISGVSLGIIGIGIPDIPIFTGMILKCIYEIALNYGYDYDSPEEKYFILLIIEGAISYEEHLIKIDNRIEEFINNHKLPDNYDFKKQIENTSNALSKELLYMKFLQGIPIIGAVGGAYDVICMKQIAKYAKLKYQKRFLLKLQ